MLTTRDGPAVIDMPKPDIGRKSRFLSQLGGFRRNVAITFATEKLECCEKKFEDVCFRSTEYTNVTDGRTDIRTDTAGRHKPRLCTASRGN